MKKKILLFALVAIMAFSAVSVSASSLRNFYPTNDSYSFTYNVGADNATQQYGMIVVAGTPDEGLDMNDILYIGQAAADEEGNIVFENFAPMGEAPSDYEGSDKGDGDTDYFEECTVFIGGKGISDGEGENAKAQAIGILKNGAGVPLTGIIKDDVSSKVATVKVLSGSNEIARTTTEANGNFAFQIPTGADYTVEVTKKAYLTFKYTDVDVTEALDLGTIDMTKNAGNIVEDSQITIEDLKILLADYGKAKGSLANEESNINGDSQVTIEDLKALLAGYGKGHTTTPFIPAQ